MAISIGCKELRFHCRFVTEGETGKVVIESLVRRVHKEHNDGRFEIEEIYQATWLVILEKAA